MCRLHVFTCIWKCRPVIASVINFCSYIYNYTIDPTTTLKGIAHPKTKILSLITLLLSFIFRTRIEIFLMKSESFLAVHDSNATEMFYGLEM